MMPTLLDVESVMTNLGQRGQAEALVVPDGNRAEYHEVPPVARRPTGLSSEPSQDLLLGLEMTTQSHFPEDSSE